MFFGLPFFEIEPIGVEGKNHRLIKRKLSNLKRIASMRQEPPRPTS